MIIHVHSETTDSCEIGPAEVLLAGLGQESSVIAAVYFALTLAWVAAGNTAVLESMENMAGTPTGAQ